MKKRRRESRKARVDILLIGNQSFHLFLYPLIIFTFFQLPFLVRVFFPPSIQFLPISFCLLWLPARPAPGLSVIWKSTRMSTTGPRLWPVEPSKTTWEILSIKMCCFYWHLDREGFWHQKGILMPPHYHNYHLNHHWYYFWHPTKQNLVSVDEGSVLWAKGGRDNVCRKSTFLSWRPAPLLHILPTEANTVRLPIFLAPKNGQRCSRLQIHSL